MNLVWIDLEMTGLIPEKERIIEIATVVTDSNLNILAEGPSIAIKQPDSLLDNMDDWNTDQHGRSGLIDRVRQSDIDESQAMQSTIQFLLKWVKKGESPMCGNSISLDRRFLIKYMPELESIFHYRNIDVSTLKELAKRWTPEIESGFNKKGAHLALDDIYDSIAELAYYRKNMFNC
ncbi:oligoribonuclease [Gammaproteobacteria bacterium]|nr:oligoribonuclease [Gammaproteobacteria bacterium]